MAGLAEASAGARWTTDGSKPIKPRYIVLVALLAAGVLAAGSLALAALSGGYTFDSFALDGGGGSSARGNHPLTSASGQHANSRPGAGHHRLPGEAGARASASQKLYFPLLVR